MRALFVVNRCFQDKRLRLGLLGNRASTARSEQGGKLGTRPATQSPADDAGLWVRASARIVLPSDEYGLQGVIEGRRQQGSDRHGDEPRDDDPPDHAQVEGADAACYTYSHDRPYGDMGSRYRQA